MNAAHSFASRLGEIALSHHLPHEHDRCVVIAGRHVCRRCLVLYPLAFAVMFLALGGTTWPERLDPALLLGLPIPVTVEFVGEKLGLLRYSARRQVLFTAIAAPALGTGLGQHILSPFPKWFLIMVLVHGGTCALAHVVASSRVDRAERAQRLATEDPIRFSTGSRTPTRSGPTSPYRESEAAVAPETTPTSLSCLVL